MLPNIYRTVSDVNFIKAERFYCTLSQVVEHLHGSSPRARVVSLLGLWLGTLLGSCCPVLLTVGLTTGSTEFLRN